jgi:hypothetical protein
MGQEEFEKKMRKSMGGVTVKEGGWGIARKWGGGSGFTEYVFFGPWILIGEFIGTTSLGKSLK